MLPEKKLLMLLRNVVKRIADPNSRQNYKGVRGRIGVVGGARDYAGAPYLAAISAMRLGADLAYVICSEKAGQVIKGYSPDVIVTPLLDCEDESLFVSEMDCLLKRIHSLVIGPGLGREKLMQARARKLIEMAKERSLELVLDADSLILVNEDRSIIEKNGHVLLTPNRIELQRLLESVYPSEKFNDLRKMELKEIEDLVQRCSQELEVSILAKGMVDIAACPGMISPWKYDKSGSNRRCGGQGDILSGIAAVYMHWLNSYTPMSLTCSPANAGCLAAMTTRKVNELTYGEFKGGMLASHMLDKINPALAALLEEIELLINTPPPPTKSFSYAGSLNQDEINRYRRQMIMPDFGPEKQMRLKKSSAIIIGAGGLGCPVAVYLAAGGFGRLGLVDDDVVEASNLHRQILHNIHKIGELKVESIKQAVLDINPNVQVDLHPVKMRRDNAVRLIQDYDMVIDATDNLLTRYMISDACVVAKKPLISGAALGMDGQMTVYNYDKDTPCFRCLFPKPPPSAAVGSCSENGVLGVVPGVIGVQQAMEAVKIGSGLGPSHAGKMLLFDGQLGRIRQVTLSKRRANCEACGPESNLGPQLVDYESFCKVGCATEQSAPQILAPEERITPEHYCEILKSNRPHVLIDVRPLAHSEVSRFAHALQIPVSQLDRVESVELIRSELEKKKTNELFVVCRRGIASQKGARLIQQLSIGGKTLVVKDLIGGMTAWSTSIDHNYSCL